MERKKKNYFVVVNGVKGFLFFTRNLKFSFKQVFCKPPLNLFVEFDYKVRRLSTVIYFDIGFTFFFFFVDVRAIGFSTKIFEY